MSSRAHLTVTQKFGEALYMVLSYSLSFSQVWAKMHLDEAIETIPLAECYISISVLERVHLYSVHKQPNFALRSDRA